MRALDRREFLQLSALGLLGRFSGSVRADTAAGPIRPCPPESWHKGAIVLGREGGPNDRWVQNFTCPAEPLEHARWRLWYSQAGGKVAYNIAVAEGVPGEAMDRHIAVLSAGDPEDAPLAVGNLPETWRPVQPVHLVLPNGKHRLYFWAHGPGVVRYLAAESADGCRYRVLDPLRPCLYHPSDRAVDGKVAAELGLKRLAHTSARPVTNEPLAPARLVSNDATNVYCLPDGSFEMYSVGLLEVPKGDPRYIAHDNAAGWARVIDRYTSADGLNWEDRRRILVPDDKDPVDQQFYYLAVTHTDRGRVGMLGHYRVEAQTMDLEWCFSEDGMTWDRPMRKAWLPRGQSDEPDCYGIYAPHSLVQHDDQWWLYYTGVNTSHNGKDSHGDPGNVVRLARCDSIWG